jgi:hypothetical protein
MLATRGQALHVNIEVRVLVWGLPHIGIKISGIWIGLVVVHSGDVGIQTMMTENLKTTNSKQP